jgi:hypothetical protein
MTVEYDYVGGSFTTVFGGLFTTSDRVTGSVILANALPASTIVDVTPVSFSFTDGVDTITSTEGNLGFGIISFTTDASGQIVKATADGKVGNGSTSFNTVLPRPCGRNP